MDKISVPAPTPLTVAADISGFNSKRDRLAAKVAAVYRTALLSALANAVNGGILAFANRSVIEPGAIAVWLGWIGIAVTVRMGAWWLQRSRDPDLRRPNIWRNAAIASAALSGLGWGLAPIIFLTELSPFALAPGGLLNVAITITFVAGMAAGSLASFGTITPAFRSYVILALLPIVFAFATVPTELRLLLSLAALIYLIVLLIGGQAYGNLFDQALRSNSRNAALVKQLTRENRRTEKLNEELRLTQAELRNSNDRLETRVQERTSELDTVLANLRREMEGRQSLEHRLVEAQKMEALGQLTGGVAHDFNNLLTVILGNLELMRDRTAGDSDISDATERALAAVRRGTSLTWRLLAFSRQQVLRPHPADLSEFAVQVVELLKRTLNETIEIRVESGAETWPVNVDTDEFQNVLINLALNARDAMPDGGALTLRTENLQVTEPFPAQDSEVPVGEFVTIAVSDSGLGMDDDTRRRAVEPFFTTKDVGAGTGLGLSMAYGFIRQSGGHIGIESGVGRGTTVTIYLPRSTGGIGETTHRTDAAQPDSGKVVFVVEDDPDVRELTARHLQVLGYDVITAPDGVAALRMIDDGVTFDLLLSDVVMPGGVSGPDLVREITRRGIKAPKLLCSGHTREMLSGVGGLAPDTELLSKPFGREELASYVSRALRRGV